MHVKAIRISNMYVCALIDKNLNLNTMQPSLVHFVQCYEEECQVWIIYTHSDQTTIIVPIEKRNIL